MLHTVLYLSICVIAQTSALKEGLAYSDNNDEQWAYTWYTGEPFSLVCNSSKLNVQTGHYVEWETPSKQQLKYGNPDNSFTVLELNQIKGMELNIRSIHDGLHGVYICTVHRDNDTVQINRMILSLNYHDKKYRDISDKYQGNIAAAFITTLIFVVPAVTFLVVYYYRYRTPDQKEQRYLKKKSTRKFMYGSRDIPMDLSDYTSDYSLDNITETTSDNETYENRGFAQV